MNNDQMKKLGFRNVGNIYWNLPTGALYEEIVKRREGLVAHKGPIVVRTGHHMGRSREDKYVVRDPANPSHILWGKTNKPFEEDHFHSLYNRLKAYLQGKDIFVQDCYAGADPKYRVPIRVISENAWHSLYARNLFIQSTDPEELTHHEPECTIIDVPRFHAFPEFDGTHSETFVIVNFGEKMILIGGTSYAGEIKRSSFTILNYAFLSEGNILPMHCAVNTGCDDENDVAVFFGLSGTGKTALALVEGRRLIGNDEHGWSDDGVFNFEGGCYSRVAGLTIEKNPALQACVERFGTVLENVTIDMETRRIDLSDTALTENTRAAYHITAIENAVASGRGAHPKHLFMLTRDVSGVMPPVACLNTEQALYFYLLGYTSEIEEGRVVPTFNPCFGAPFLALSPLVYARILGEKIARHHVQCWMINTGWTGGPLGEGHRIGIEHSRAIVRAVLSGKLDSVPMRKEPVFGFEVPEVCEGLPPEFLDPRQLWKDRGLYDTRARELVGQFKEYFDHFSEEVPIEIRRAGP
ncbi:MAG: phosphoenolpyruvate carboxykinase (ATP) [Deltaproteobacteria bacterium]|nr:phosphoenolpyruvate carboxykinase (ATP) [Deltaproteobacteria bacterium]